MKSFYQFFLEYHHNLGDGTKNIHTPFIGKNGNGPGKGSNITIDPTTRKIPQIVGDYKPKNAAMHKPGQIFIGPQLDSVLLDYNIDFNVDEPQQIKNSPYAIKMSINPQTRQRTGVIIQTKPAPVK